MTAKRILRAFKDWLCRRRLALTKKQRKVAKSLVRSDPAHWSNSSCLSLYHATIYRA